MHDDIASGQSDNESRRKLSSHETLAFSDDISLPLEGCEDASRRIHEVTNDADVDGNDEEKVADDCLDCDELTPKTTEGASTDGVENLLLKVPIATFGVAACEGSPWNVGCIRRRKRARRRNLRSHHRQM